MPAIAGRGCLSELRYEDLHIAGDERPGTIPADIVFVISEKKHPVFEREGNDLTHTARLPLVDALCGATIKLTTLDGRPLTVRSNATMTCVGGESHFVIPQTFRFWTALDCMSVAHVCVDCQGSVLGRHNRISK